MQNSARVVTDEQEIVDVDKNVPAGASRFLAVPQAVIGGPYPLETEAPENRQFPSNAENCLGHIGSPVDTLWRFLF
jgi:hypothetical protein